MKFYIMSDLHNEFHKLNLDACGGGKDDTLLLAGDIGVVAHPETLIPFLIQASVKFKWVIGIPGNHEYYSGDYPWAIKHVQHAMTDRNIQNVFYNDKHVVKIDDVAVIAATLWTDFGEDPICKISSGMHINDFKAIIKPLPDQKTFTVFTTNDAIAAFKDHYSFIKTNLAFYAKIGKKRLVMTHFAPTLQSVHQKYAGDLLNRYFVNDLENDIILMGEKDIHPEVWVHGHVHTCFDYAVEKTRVIANPRGYPGEQKEFDINKMVEL